MPTGQSAKYCETGFIGSFHETGPARPAQKEFSPGQARTMDNFETDFRSSPVPSGLPLPSRPSRPSRSLHPRSEVAESRERFRIGQDPLCRTQVPFRTEKVPQVHRSFSGEHITYTPRPCIYGSTRSKVITFRSSSSPSPQEHPRSRTHFDPKRAR